MPIVFLDIKLLLTNRLQYSVNITSECTGKPKTSFDSLYCSVYFIGVVCNGTRAPSRACLYSGEASAKVTEAAGCLLSGSQIRVLVFVLSHMK